MKTLNYFFAAAVLSIALVSCQKETIEPQRPADNNSQVQKTDAKIMENASIKTSATEVSYNTMIYLVTIHLEREKPLCNTYVVKLTDGDGREIALPVRYDPATSIYTFRERTNEASGVRVAHLDLVVWPNHFVCPTEYTTDPAISVIDFKEGGTYSFDLYPKPIGPKVRE
jgi:hypothetical protein